VAAGGGARPAPTDPAGARGWGSEGREWWGGAGAGGSGRAAATDTAAQESTQPVAEAGDLEKGPGWWRWMGFAVAGCEDEGEGDAMEEGGGRTRGTGVDRSVGQADAGGVDERRVGGGAWSAFRGGQAGRGWGRGDGGGGGGGGAEGACLWWFGRGQSAREQETLLFLS
jgi:hypothetical protein